MVKETSIKTTSDHMWSLKGGTILKGVKSNLFKIKDVRGVAPPVLNDHSISRTFENTTG